MTTCPKCRSRDLREHKSWEIKPKGARGVPMRITVYSCRSCGSKFRKAASLTHIHEEHPAELVATPISATTELTATPQTELAVAPAGAGSSELTDSPLMQPLSVAEAAGSPVGDVSASSPGNGNGQSGGWFHRFKEKFHNIF